MDGLANFLPYAGLPLLLFLPVSLFVRKRTLTLIACVPVVAWLLIIATPYLFLARAGEPSPGAPRLRVVTANVLMSNDQLPALAEDVLAQAPDVIVFEELTHDLATVVGSPGTELEFAL